MFDTLIENCLVVDGTGQPGSYRPVAIKNGIIALPRRPVSAKQTIDAHGLVLAPGFIDIHSHSSVGGLLESRGQNKLSQGITTEITGNCGILPDFPDGKGQPVSGMTQFTEYLAHFHSSGLPMNIGFYIGHGSVRAATVGYMDRPPTPKELATMKDMVAQGMEYGAVGLSTGLVYPPGAFAKTDELIELCKVVAADGGVYATHLRSEGDGLLAALKESISIAQGANIRLQVSHLKATGKNNWGQVSLALANLEAAAAQGLEASCDFYPYTASSTGLISQLPNWVQEGGWKSAKLRLRDPALHKKILGAVSNSIEKSAGWEGVIVSSIDSLNNRCLEGESLAEIGKSRGIHPAQALVDLLLEEEGSPGMIKFSISEADVNTVAAHRFSMVGSDGLAMTINDPRFRKPHPRNYGAFPRVFRLQQRELRLFSLETAIYKMTGAPAAKLNLLKRGLVREGFHGDLVLFDPDTIADTATYAEPHQLSKGIHSVWVNGELAYQQGRCLGPGRGTLVSRRS